jgi:hypothetical protein
VIMEGFAENIYDVIFHPAEAMRRIAAQKLAGEAVIVFALSVVVPAVAFYLAVAGSVFDKFLPVCFSALILGGFCAWLCGAAVFSMVAEFLGGTGTSKGLFAAMGFAHLPRVLAVPFFVLERLFPDGIIAAAAGVVFVATFVWMLVLDVIAIRSAHGISYIKAVLTLLLPLLILIVTVLALAILAGVSMFSDWA